jgi:hypothetical protein
MSLGWVESGVAQALPEATQAQRGIRQGPLRDGLIVRRQRGQSQVIQSFVEARDGLQKLQDHRRVDDTNFVSAEFFRKFADKRA